LKSLRRLELDADQVNADLIAAVNAHPKLHTVTIHDTHLDTLGTLASSTSLSLSKILINSAILESARSRQASALRCLMSQRPRLRHLILRDKSILRDGGCILFLPGLEKLDITVYSEPTFPMAWMPAFVARHHSLAVITFSGDKFNPWKRNPDLLFPLQFLDAVERHSSLARAVFITSFSISRPGSLSSVDDWPVAELELALFKAIGISSFKIASTIAPRLSSLIVTMSHFDKRSIPIVSRDVHLIFDVNNPLG
jgi:hypothetical protein